MHENTLPKTTRALLEKISTHEFIKNFYLAGGTALALHIGHRVSVDLDFFSQKKFDTNKLLRELAVLGSVKILLQDDDSLVANIGGAKASFLYYPHQMLHKPKTIRNNVAAAGIEDIACMKVTAISSRGTKRDFVDFYYLLKIHPFFYYLQLMPKKYKNLDFSEPHLLKSLVFFADAEKDAMPALAKKISWGTIKSAIVLEVKKLV